MCVCFVSVCVVPGNRIVRLLSCMNLFFLFMTRRALKQGEVMNAERKEKEKEKEDMQKSKREREYEGGDREEVEVREREVTTM